VLYRTNWAKEDSAIIFPMNTPTTERSNCRFTIRKGESDKPQIVLELFQPISRLKDAKLGCELLGGTSVDQAKIIAAFLNEHVLNIFVETSSREEKLDEL
jgi:hypothetical protein